MTNSTGGCYVRMQISDARVCLGTCYGVCQCAVECSVYAPKQYGSRGGTTAPYWYPMPRELRGAT